MPRPRTEPPQKPIRIHEDVYDAIMVLAAIYKRSMPQFTSDILEPIVVKALAEQGMSFPVKPRGGSMSEVVAKTPPKVKAPRAKRGPKSGRASE
jgi:hypothetical protein